MTPLLTACDEGYTEVVQVLLKGKADPNLPAEVTGGRQSCIIFLQVLPVYIRTFI